MDHEFHSKTKFLTARTVDSSASEVESTDHFSDFLVALDDYNDTLEDNLSKRSKKLRIDMKYSKIFLKKILEKNSKIQKIVENFCSSNVVLFSCLFINHVSNYFLYYIHIFSFIPEIVIFYSNGNDLLFANCS